MISPIQLEDKRGQLRIMRFKITILLLAVAAFILAAARINHGLLGSSLPAGPGLTLDESFNIGQGIYLFESLLDHGPLLWTPTVAQEVFGKEGYLPDHPPLGRLVLGAAHQLTAGFISGAESAIFNVPAARLGACLAFAVTAFVLGEFVRRRYGLLTAVLAMLTLMLMPRVVGHARIAALESTTMLAWLAALIPLLSWWTSGPPPTPRQSLVSGLFWGLLMLTKVQGILLPPLIVAWALWQYRWRAVGPLVFWGLAGGVIFFVGWPWLWLDPVNNTLKYLGSASDRLPLYVWYFGQRFADKSVPWHFPAVMLATTLPTFVIVAVVIRMLQRRFDKVEQLLLASMIWPPLVFALPGTPVYDGTRLFLVIMPAVAFLAARGVAGPWVSNSRVTSTNHRRLALRALAMTGFALLGLAVLPRAFSPFALCDYNLLIGGPQGALKAGLESSYWSDGLNGKFWSQVPEGSTVYVAPVSHQFQLTDIQQLVPEFQRRGIHLEPFLYNAQQQVGLLLMLHRLADLRPALRYPPDGATVIADVRYQGVVLASLFDTSTGNWSELPDWP